MKLLKNILVIAVLFSITACDVEADLCDELVLNPSKNVSLVGNVTASGLTSLVPVKIRFYKTACGQSEPKPGSTFTYSGILSNLTTSYQSGTVNYELRSSDDYITVELHVDEMNNGNYEIVQAKQYFHQGLSTSLNTINFTMN